jgi:hypothetical protein
VVRKPGVAALLGVEYAIRVQDHSPPHGFRNLMKAQVLELTPRRHHCQDIRSFAGFIFGFSAVASRVRHC